MTPFMVEAVTGGMELTWQVDPVGLDGYNVYRRTTDTYLMRLNSSVLPIGSGQLAFMDAGEGLANGETVYYAFTLVVDGQESGFSEEVEATFKSGVPLVFALYDNYQNPFNPITNIKFDLPQSGHVRLDIFDKSRRLIRVLIDENRAAASHTVVWDGTDHRGGRNKVPLQPIFPEGRLK